MGKYSRNKGKRGQRDLVHLLQKLGWQDPHTESGSQSASPYYPDVDAVDLPFWLEVKVGGKPNVLQAFRQASRDAEKEGKDRIPCAVVRLVSQSGSRDDPCKQWLALVPAEILLRPGVI